MKKVLGFALVAGLLALIAPEALAQSGGTLTDATQNVGQSALGGVSSLLSGNIALVIGLCLGVFGLWTWLVKQETWGIILILGGVVLTAFPGIFDSITTGSTNIIGTITGNDAVIKNRADDVIN